MYSINNFSDKKNDQNDYFSKYYQAHVDKKMTWFVVATLKSYEHMQFDRTIDPEQSIFEFFVPQDMEQLFLAVIKRLSEKGYVSGLIKQENRLKTENY